MNQTCLRLYTFIFIFPLFILKIIFDLFTDEPSFTCDARLEVVENGALPCEPDGIPTPVITWFKDGKEMASPPLWTKDDSGKYSLEATNEHGIATHALNVDVLCMFGIIEIIFVYCFFDGRILNNIIFSSQFSSPQMPLCSRTELSKTR